MKIQKYQAGGAIYTPLVPTEDPIEQTTSKSSGVSQEDKTKKMIDEEVLKILSQEGITSDVNSFLSQVENTSNNMQSFYTGGQKDFTMNDIVRLRAKANEVKFNAKVRDEVYDKLIKENALEDICVTAGGGLYVFNTEKRAVEVINPTKLNEKDNKYQVISNNELLRLREQNYAFDTSIFQALQNTTSISTVMTSVKDIISTFKEKNKSDYTLSSKDKEIKNGLDYLLDSGTPYEYSTSTNVESVEQALKYIWNILPKNEKEYLQTKTIAEGGTSKDVFQLLHNALQLQTKTDYKVKLDNTMLEQTGIKKGGSEEKLVQMDDIDQVASGRGGVPQQFTFHGHDDNYALNIPGIQYGVPQKNDRTALGTSTLDKILNNDSKFKLGLRDQISFGDIHIQPSEFNRVIWDEESAITRLIVPFTRDNNNKRIVDLNMLQRYSDFQDLIKTSDISTKDKLALAKNQFNLNLTVKKDESGKEYFSYGGQYMEDYGPALSFIGISVDDKLTSAQEDSPWYKKLSSTEAKNARTILNKAFTNEETGQTAKFYDDVYKAPVFVIMDPNAAAYHGTHDYVAKETYNNLSGKLIMNDVKARANIITTI